MYTGESIIDYMLERGNKRGNGEFGDRKTGRLGSPTVYV